ncbi:peptide chain release factor N(5)-glutamine methyltransferase [Hyphomicrobium sulfonivorans]|uniref:peptide chain release factor N(5)-glutamine methyltransferase n=1 Tax=Hyphomicrobium sulfonivorans TaxID=121290 RepID=UPI00156FD196|nr:peptide chain release factor N(5)-glutamine methyltransferase [Hyphomicrobium sulfonivorans]NSL73326.1 peptide chain release factor N(5)-glutamine methyltransferase [Hyphomicrobium sulfonivorans]
MPPEHPSAITLGDAVRETQRQLTAAGIEEAGREARLIVASVCGLPTSEIIVRPERPLGVDEQQRLAAMVARRCAREPISRIVGEREFYGRRFKLSAATLDPRPDSETLIDAVLGLVSRERWAGRPIRVLDIGTGTGCLLLTLLAELPNATGLGTDISAEALKTAAANAEVLGLAARASFARHDVLEGVNGPFDLVISNPPYIETGVIAGLDPEVQRFDPMAALDGGPDGLAIYRRIAGDLGRVLTGWVVLEVGAGQADAVASVFQQAFVKTRQAELRRYDDLGGHTRCVAIRLQT